MLGTDTEEVRSKKFIALNLVLNCRFLNGQYQSEMIDNAGNIKKLNYLQVYQTPRIQCSVVMHQDIFYSRERLAMGDPNTLIEVDEKSPYEQRPLSLNDGLLYYYSENNGKIRDDYSSKNNKIQMLICVTIYNEKKNALMETLMGIQENLPYFQKIGIEPERIVVVVLQDGIMKMSETLLEFYKNEVDCFVDINGQDQSFKVTERYQTIKKDQEFYNKNNPGALSANNDIPPTVPKKIALVHQVQIDYLKNNKNKLTTFFVNKHLNGKKLSSHMWFFEGFCRLLNPKYVCLVDGGTRPDKEGIVNFYKAMEKNPRIGGVCGFMGLYNGKDTRDKEDQKKQQPEKRPEEHKQAPMQPNQLKEAHPEHIELQLLNTQEKKNPDDELFDKRMLYFEKRNQFLKNQKKFQEIYKNVTEYFKNQDQQKEKIGGCQCFSLSTICFCLLNCISGLFMCLLSGVENLLVAINSKMDPRKAQIFEYLLAHILDKNFESYFDFLHVLPGAWSAYKWAALSVGQRFKEDLLEERYLKIVLNENAKEKNFKEANMFLAEDRILCLGIYCQMDRRYILKYVENAIANTDAVDDFETFIIQRRRWINSTWFALEFVLRNYQFHIQNSKHSWWTQQVTTRFSMLMAWLNKINMYLLPGFFYFALHVSCYQLIGPHIQDWNQLLYFIPGLLPFSYAFLLIYMVLVCLHFKPDYKTNYQNSCKFDMMSAIIGIYQFLMYFILIYNAIANYILNIFDYHPTGADNRILQILIYTMAGSNFGTMVLLVLINWRHIPSILSNLVHYIYFSGAYTHTFVIYSFCNVDDVSWGTKGLTKNDKQINYKTEKLLFVGKWMFSNAILVYILISVNGIWGHTGWVLVALGLYGSAIMFIKFFFAFLNRLAFMLSCQTYKKSQKDDNSKTSGIVKYEIWKKYQSQPIQNNARGQNIM